MAVAALEAINAHAAGPALNAFGQSGGLVIPYGTVLAPGQTEFQFNTFKDPHFAQSATTAQSYYAAMGLFPYVELSGGMVNYARTGNVTLLPGAESELVRHIEANFKVAIPKFLPYQPDIAIGTTDYGGQTSYFRSRYIVASQAIGPLSLTLGAGDGPQRLNGIFGGGELSIWHTGLSVLAEDDSRVAYVGVRYRSPPIPWLANAQILGTAQRALNAKLGDQSVNRTAVSVGIQIPLGGYYRRDTAAGAPLPPAANPPPQPYPAAMVAAPVPVKVIATAPGVGESSLRDSTEQGWQRGDTVQAHPLRLSSAPELDSDTPRTYGTPMLPMLPDLSGKDGARDPRMLAAGGQPSAFSGHDEAPDAATIAERLPMIQQKLIEMGLENVAVGSYRNYLVVEYENHRYNQNESDALGVVLGIAARYAPHNFTRILAVIKKADMPLGQVSVDRASYARFLRDGSNDASVRATLVMTTRPTYAHDDVQWSSAKEGPHGLTRIKITPATSYVFGTEYGKFDYALGANIQGFVPLWKGAELYASFIEPLINSHNVDDRRVFSDIQLRRGLATLALNQIMWAGNNVMNVASVGKFGFHYLGIEDETTFFVPTRPDIVRLRVAYLRPSNSQAIKTDPLFTEKNAVLTYRWVQPDWNMWIEGGVARYVGGDKGEIVNLVKWFDDVSVTVNLTHSSLATFAGVSLGFPLTPRQGMKPGITSLSGSESYYANLQTRIRGTNFLNTTGAQNISFDYSTQQILLNEGRFSEEYFKTQLYRMRDAYRRFVPGQAIPAAPVPAQMTAK
jgi:hypothetical protein